MPDQKKRGPFKYFKSSPEIIRLAVMLYIRFFLSFRNAEDLLHERCEAEPGRKAASNGDRMTIPDRSDNGGHCDRSDTGDRPQLGDALVVRCNTAQLAAVPEHPMM